MFDFCCCRTVNTVPESMQKRQTEAKLQALDPYVYMLRPHLEKLCVVHCQLYLQCKSSDSHPIHEHSTDFVSWLPTSFA